MNTERSKVNRTHTKYMESMEYFPVNPKILREKK